jgi:hypothetical protein
LPLIGRGCLWLSRCAFIFLAFHHVFNGGVAGQWLETHLRALQSAVVAIEEMGGPAVAWRPGRKDLAAENCPPNGRLPDADKVNGPPAVHQAICCHSRGASCWHAPLGLHCHRPTVRV